VIKISKYTLDYIISEIKRNIPILTVVEESSLQLRKRGQSYKGICPFHNEKTSSFSVHPKKNIFKCFGCEVKGDQIKLYALLNGIENGQAIKILKKRIGLSGKRITNEQKIEISKRQEDKLLEKKFEQECKSLFDFLCSLRDLMRATATTHADMEQMEQDFLLIRYYHESAYYEQLIHELVAVLFDEMDFERQIDIYKIAKGVAKDWKQLLEKQKPIFYEKLEWMKN
jgi:hypothetical protein